MYEFQALFIFVGTKKSGAKVWVVVFDGTAPEKTGPKDGTKF